MNNSITNKFSKTNNFDNLKKFDSERIKNDEMFVVTGGNTANSASVCHADGEDCDGQFLK